MVRLRRSRLDGPGWTRRRAGRGFVYLDEAGHRIDDPQERARIAALAIPPAWRDVWICPWPHGHVQAIGVDAAGRRQYLYHPQWRRRRDRLKHDHVLEMARRLPGARRTVRRDVRLPGMPRAKALALAFLLLDLAYLRVGGEGYAVANGSYGLATLRREHVRVHADGTVHLTFPAKSGQVRDTLVDDAEVAAAVRTLVRRHDDNPELLAWKDGTGWHDVTSADVGAYVRDRLGGAATPKDFRTWHATVLAARALAAVEVPHAERARRRVVAQVARDVAEELGNTPAVCRASYIDPRLIDLWEAGRTIGRRRTRAGAERAVAKLLAA